MITTTQTRHPQVLKCVIAWCETKQMFKIDCYLFQKCDLYWSEHSYTGSIPSFSFDVVSLLMLLLDRLNAYIKQTIKNTVKFCYHNVTLLSHVRINLTCNFHELGVIRAAKSLCLKNLQEYSLRQYEYEFWM